MRKFNEDTRVKIPATLHFMRLGYSYQSLKDADVDFDTKILVNRFKPAIEKINRRDYSNSEIESLLQEIHELIRNNDLGRAFYKRLTDTTAETRLIDFDDIGRNDFAVADELPFTVKRDSEEGSFRPDIVILINGMPLAFLEVKKPNNAQGIQAEFNRMINKRLVTPGYQKYFNLIQVVSFSNNMEYEDNDSVSAELIRAGSFYTAPNGKNTSFSFFREDIKNYHSDYEYGEVDEETARKVIRDLGYSPDEYDAPEFRENSSVMTPCNRFITSLYDHERFLFLLHYGLLYIKGQPPQKHIMRYPQFFATRAIIDRLESGGKRGIVWHTQGSGKTELSVYANKIIRDYYAKQNRPARFFFVVDRLDLLRQDNGEFASRYFTVSNAVSKADFSNQLNAALPNAANDTDGEFVVVNIQKFESAIPKARNDYKSNIQRVFFIDEAHRSYALNGEYFKNLILCDPDAVFIALTGTPLLSKKERSNLKFGDYIHKYFYDKSIADGYTLRIKKEKIDTVARKNIKENLNIEETELDTADVYESDEYVEALGNYISKDFRNFRIVNNDDSIGGMVVCRSNPQASKIHEWFRKNSDISTGLVLSDAANPEQNEINKNNQLDFKYTAKPDMLIVHFMLTVGYDVARLKKMYLLRGPKAQNLLQTISRVNRPYRSANGKTYNYGYITDFVDIEKEYDRTLNDYLKELENDITETDEEGSLSGLLVDADTIRNNYRKYRQELDSIIIADDMETYSRRLSMYSKEALLKIKRLLNSIKSCYIELLLSNADEDASKIDIEEVKSRLKATQERINFINLRESPVRMMDVFSNEEVVEIMYDFIMTSISIIDIGKFDTDNEIYQDFKNTIEGIQKEIRRNRNKDDINIIRLDEMLQKLFSRMDIHDLDDLRDVNDEMKDILLEAIRINRENERLASIFGGSYAMVKTYQDATSSHPDLSNKDIEDAVRMIHDAISDVADPVTISVQGRQGFVDETKKKSVKMLLKSGLYKSLGLKSWIDTLLSEMYTNIHNY